MRYLVTGVGGFVGSTLAETLINEGHGVVGIDDFSTGLRENLLTFWDHKNFTLIETDISANTFVDDMQHHGTFDLPFDGVFHFAALSRIPLTMQDPRKSHNSNITGLFNTLQLMRKIGIKKIVFSSSAAIYGSKNSPPQTESMIADCMNPYALGKLVGEEYIKTFCRMFSDMDGVCLRYFNIWGPREMLLGGVAPIVGLFFKRVLQDKAPISIVGTGEQSRDYVHVYDIVRANILAMQCETKLSGDAFNIGTGINHSVFEISEMVLKSLNMDPSSHRVFVPAVANEMSHMQADNAKAKNILGWSPTILLTQETINNHRDYYLKKWAQ